MADTDRQPENGPNAAGDGPQRGRRKRYKARYVHRSAVRGLVFRLAEETGRGGVIQRVGDELFVHLDAMVLAAVTALVRQHPSGFKTLEPYTPARRRQKS